MFLTKETWLGMGEGNKSEPENRIVTQLWYKHFFLASEVTEVKVHAGSPLYKE